VLVLEEKGDTLPASSAWCAFGSHCRAPQRQPLDPTHYAPLCPTCLDHAAVDIRRLLFDYLDLAQLQYPTLTHNLHRVVTAPRSTPHSHMPIKPAPEALQAEILHTVTTWEVALCRHVGLPEPDTRVRRGMAVQRATTLLAARVDELACVAPIKVRPTGCEDEPVQMAGWEAIAHMQALHHRARSMLGLTQRIRILPGTCPHCHTGQLAQDEPRYVGDPCDVRCLNCGINVPYEHYEQWVSAVLFGGGRGTS